MPPRRKRGAVQRSGEFHPGRSCVSPRGALLAGFGNGAVWVAAMSFSVATALSGGSAARTNPGGYHPPNTPSSAWTTNAVLCYMDGRSLQSSPSFSETYSWTPDKFEKLYGFQSQQNVTLDYFFDSFLFLGYTWLDGKSFWPGQGTAPLNSTDWTQFLDLQVSAMEHLGTAAVTVANELAVGVPGRSGCGAGISHALPSVFLSVIAPDSRQNNFGPVVPDGPSLNFSNNADRLAAAKWSVDLAVKAASNGSLGVNLVGFYWFVEDVGPADAGLVTALCNYVHTQYKLRVIWIPYYDAPGGYDFEYWSGVLGFDAVFLQPNFAFHNSSYVDRFEAVNATASENYLGVELELPMYIRNPQLQDWMQSIKLYLEAGVHYGFMQNAVKAYYEGNDFVNMQLGNSTLYGIYRSIYAFAKGTYPNTNFPWAPA